MSVIRKTPFIYKMLSKMTTEEKQALQTCLNEGGSNVNATIDNLPDKGITPVYFTFEDGKFRTGILVYTDDHTEENQDVQCVLLCYHRFQDIQIFNFDLTNNTYKEIKEDCTILELRVAVKNSIGVSVEGLTDVLIGSDTIVVDESEEGGQVQVRLDNDYKNKVDRALATPLSAPTDTALVAVGTGREQEQVYIGDGLELVGDTSPYTLKATEFSQLGDRISILERIGRSKIYGVDGIGQSSPTLTRTDAAVGLSYSVGGSQIMSDFDDCFPWSQMSEVVDSHGNVFIKVPKFYSKITENDGGTFKLQISGIKYEGFSTLFIDGKGNEIDYVLIGKYEATVGLSGGLPVLRSVSGNAPLTNTTIGTFRQNARNIGQGYQQYDFLIDAIIKELFMIEFATTNCQSVMTGFTSSSNTGSIFTGHTDSVVTASGSYNSNSAEHSLDNTSGFAACMYRGIENPWGNIWKWCDGINFQAEKIYICNDPTKYASNKYDDGYEYVGDRTTSEGYAKVVSRFANFNLLAFTTGVGATASTYYCDYHYYSASGTVLSCGGAWYYGAYAGLWAWSGNVGSSYSSGSVGGRLCYKPL